MRVIRLTRSAYGNGFIIGKANKMDIRSFLNLYGKVENWKRFAKEMWMDPTIERNISNWTQEDLYHYAETAYQKRIAAIPDLNKYPELKGMDAYIIDYMKGLAEGTELSFKDIIFNSFWYDVYKYARGEGFLTHEFGKNEKARNSDLGWECTAIVFTNTDVGVVIGRNTDDGPVQDYVYTINRCGEPLLILRPAELGYSTVDTPLAGINEKGLAMSGASTYYKEEKEGGEIFPANVHDLVMRHCSTLDEAVEMIMRYNTFTSRSGNTAIVDGNGDAAVVEKSLMECGILRPKEGEEYAFTTAGVAVHPKMRKLMDDSTDSYKFNLKRHATIKRIIEGEAELGVEAMWKVIRNHTLPSPVCRHLDEKARMSNIATLIQGVMVPKQRRYWVSYVEPGPKFPCSVEPVEHRYFFY